MPKNICLPKKTIASLLLIFLAFIGRAQPVQFGIFAGAQMTSVRYFIAEVKQPAEYKYGFQAGMTMKVPFETNLYFSPAAFYSLKGYKVKFNDFAYPPDLNAVDNNTTIHTFELAFLLQYDAGSKPNHFCLKAGPSLDFQLKGKETYHLMNGNTVSKKMKYDFGEYGHYSANLLLQPGFETKGGFMIFLHYTLGIANINNADDGPRINHKAFGISVGKFFNRNKIVIDTRNKQ